MLAMMPLVVFGVVPFQHLLNAVSWELILFLMGSMIWMFNSMKVGE